MLRELGKKITNNFGLKLLAALFAFVLWIVVINIDNPVKVQKFTTSVTAENTDYLTAQGKYYEVLDGKNTVTFNVSGERSILTEMSNSDFSATADMEKIEYNENSGVYRVPVTVTPTRYINKVTVTSKQLYLEVVLEDLGTCQKVITAATRGTVADGCALGDMEIVGSNLLKISGPSSIVSQIDTAVATINVEGVSTDVTDSVVPVLYDADGNVIDTTKLKMSLSTVTVTAQILGTKDVALEFNTSGNVKDGYMITDIECPLETIRIKGQTNLLNTVNKISVPAEVLDVTDISEDLTVTVDISSYLPEGASLVLTSDAKIEVTVKVEQMDTKSFEVPVTNLSVENLRDTYLLEFEEDTVAIEISGPESVISGLKARNIKGTIDANALGPGTHNLTVNVSLEDNCWISKTVKVAVVISRETSAESNQNSGGTSDADSSQKPTDTTNSGTGTGSDAAGDTTDASGDTTDASKDVTDTSGETTDKQP